MADLKLIADSGGGTGTYQGSAVSGSGGSGVCIFRYPSGQSINIGTGLTSAGEVTVGSEKYCIITAGSGTVSW